MKIGGGQATYSHTVPVLHGREAVGPHPTLLRLTPAQFAGDARAGPTSAGDCAIIREGAISWTGGLISIWDILEPTRSGARGCRRLAQGLQAASLAGVRESKSAGCTLTSIAEPMSPEAPAPAKTTSHGRLDAATSTRRGRSEAGHRAVRAYAIGGRDTVAIADDTKKTMR